MRLWVIITGASGAGKDLLVKKIREQLPYAGKIVTSTTRPPRSGERDGIAYHFFTHKEFMLRIQQNEFIEYKNVHGYLYGTRREDVEVARTHYALVLSIMDPFGAKTLMDQHKEVRTIFIDAPRAELYRRLIARGDRPTSIKERMTSWKKEIQLRNDFACYIENIDIEVTLKKALAQIEKWTNT